MNANQNPRLETRDQLRDYALTMLAGVVVVLGALWVMN